MEFNKIFARYTYIIASFVILSIVVMFFIFQYNKPGSLKYMLEKGEKYTNTGRLALALKHYNKTVRIYPGSYEAHLRLGDIYIKINEKEKAKIEYYRALKLKLPNRYEAHFALANLYFSQGKTYVAKDIIDSVKNIKNKQVYKGVGKFYYKWGDKQKNKSKIEAARKYKISYKFLKKAEDDREIIKITQKIENNYLAISKELINNDKLDEAINIVSSAIKWVDESAALHYHLAELYNTKDKPDKALQEFEKAFELNPNPGPSDIFISLLKEKAKKLEKQNKKSIAKFIYQKIKKMDAENEILQNTNNKVFIKLTATKFNQNKEKGTFSPGISFRIANIGKEKIDKVKLKIDFLKEDKHLSSEVVEVILPDKEIKPGELTKEITVFSKSKLSGILLNHKFQAKIFIFQKDSKTWKVLRQINFAKKQKSKAFYI